MKMDENGWKCNQYPPVQINHSSENPPAMKILRIFPAHWAPLDHSRKHRSPHQDKSGPVREIAQDDHRGERRNMEESNFIHKILNRMQ
jgi:hypothetical protein